MNKYTWNNSRECVLEVGLEYLKELRELHNDYPLPPDKIEIKKNRCWLATNQRLLRFVIFLLVMSKKLVPGFFEKENSVLHYNKLQLYLRLGLNLKKIHCVLELSQSQWLKPYVDFNRKK